MPRKVAADICFCQQDSEDSEELLDPANSCALFFFLTFTVCNATSQLADKGKI